MSFILNDIFMYVSTKCVNVFVCVLASIKIFKPSRIHGFTVLMAILWAHHLRDLGYNLDVLAKL